MAKRGILICGFAGIGKTSIKQAIPYFKDVRIYDLTTKAFEKYPGWEKIYIDCALALLDKHDYVFVSTHDVVIKELMKRGEIFHIVYPYLHCKDEYMERFRQRGSDENYIKRFRLRWESFINQLDQVKTHRKTQLRSGQYLSDVILRLKFNQ